jgi:hypothetical protein
VLGPRGKKRYLVKTLDPKALDLIEQGGTTHRTPAPSAVVKV